MSNLCNIKSHWSSSASSGIESILVASFEDNDGDINTGEPQRSPPVAGCWLSRPDSAADNSSHCSLLVSVNSASSAARITAVDVLCTARHMEVCDSTGEYLETAAGVKVQDTDAGPVYLLQHTFDRVTAGCTLNIKSAASVCKVWFHSVQVTLVKQVSNEFLSDDTINIARVRSLLGNSELSPGAQQLMKVVEQHQRQQPANNMPNLASIMNMISTMSFGVTPPKQNRETETKPAALPVCQSGPSCDNLKDNKQNLCVPNESELETLTSTPVDRGFEERLSQQFLMLEERLMSRIEIRMKESEAKILSRLDSILKYHNVSSE